MNNISLVGRVVRTPEIKLTENNTTMARFSLAVSKNKDEADFFNCTAFGKPAELISMYVSKGHRLGITGRMQSRNYVGKDGTNKIAWEVLVNQLPSLIETKAEAASYPQEETQEEEVTFVIDVEE